ncbi:MAG: hypothetical protein MUP48_03585 [Wolbachia endosymbiont of Homalodisca vitripennis]|nr:hypothetical protein [Wolbachia endosymbiont of Homalodisca vitripennis]MCJ7475508.1 hypothetical protein [Wolbachia endosymbiont of Homalodisca vitripennis]
MKSFFDKTFEEQVEEIIKTGDLKLLQALIGTRSLIGLSLYCSSFFLTRTVIAQAKYQAYSALLNVLTEYQKPEKEIFVDNIKRDIESQIRGNEDRLRQKALLPSSSSNLKSLTNSSCSDLESYVQETDVSSLCTFNLQKVIEIYHNYISQEEVKELERVLLKAKEVEDKYSYIENQKTELQYNRKRTKAFNVVKDQKPLLLKIKDKSFFDNWYEQLLCEVLYEAKRNKKHILHGEIVEKNHPDIEVEIGSAKSKLGTAFNKEAMRRVINKLVENYLRVSSTSLGVKESLLSEMKCVDISDYRGRMNHEAVNHRIISRANEVILSESIVQNNLSDDVERGFQYIVENMDVSLLAEVEQEMLNEIAERAASYRERDNKKKDLELLAICNGGEFQDKLSLPTDLSFSEIERLYKDMLLIKFKEEGELELHKLCDRLPLLELEEIKEAFPASITDDILKSMEESLGKYVKTVEDIKKEIVNNVFGKKENIEKLYELEKELEFSFMQWILHPIYYKQYEEVKKFVEFKSFVHDNISSHRNVSFREKLEEQLEKLDKPKRKELGRLLLSSIDNEFQGLANQLVSYKDELGKKATKEFRLPKLFHPSYWESYIKREKDSLKICEEALRKSVATGDDELFYKAIEDIKKDSKYMWVFQVNKAFFEGVYKTQHDSRKKTLSFRELAEKFIGNRKKYIAEQQDKYKVRKATVEQHQVNVELVQRNMDDQVEKNRLSEGKRAAEVKAEEAEVRAEEERRAREKAEAKVEMERAEKKALNLLYDEADDQDISRKRIKQDKEVQKFLECQYTFLVLNEGYTTKFKNLCKEYRELKREVKEPDFERLSKLANEFEKLSRSFIEGEKRENVPECSDLDIDRLKLSIVTRVVQARDVAEKEKRKVEKEKVEVEEKVKQLQPDTTFSNISHEQIAGPSWQI